MLWSTRSRILLSLDFLQDTSGRYVFLTGVELGFVVTLTGLVDPWRRYVHDIDLRTRLLSSTLVQPPPLFSEVLLVPLLAPLLVLVLVLVGGD